MMSAKKIIYASLILLICLLVGGLIHTNLNIEVLYREKVEKSLDCPKDKPFKIPYSDECQGCDYPYCMTIPSEDKEIFSHCQNRETLGDMSCLKICPDGWTKVGKKYDWIDGECYDCSKVNDIALIETRKDICSQCNHQYDLQNNICIPK